MKDLEDMHSETPVRRLIRNTLGYIIAQYCWTREEALDEMQNFINDEMKKLRAENVRKRKSRVSAEAHP